MPFKIVRKDIEKVKADVIVGVIADAVNSDDAAGEVSIVSTRQVPRLPAKYRISCNVPVWQGGARDEAARLRACYDRALQLASEHGCRTIAFPLMTGSSCGFPGELATQLAVDSFREFLEEHEIGIILAVSDDFRDKVSGSLFAEVRSYADNRNGGAGCRPVPQAQIFSAQGAPAQPSIAPVAMKPARSGIKMPSAPRKAPSVRKRPDAVPRMEAVSEEGALAESVPAALDDRLRKMYTDSFEKHLQQLINKKGMKNSEVYAAANISKQYFSKLMKGQVKPSKEKVLALAIGLRLNLDETVDFLRIAGYALSPVSQTDVVVEYFIQKKDYSVMKIDIVLFDYGLPLLSE